MISRTLALSALALVLVPVAASAATFHTGENISISERIQDDAYLAGGSVSSIGAVAGDLFAGGGAVLVTGVVGEDLFAGGGNVTLAGDVGGDARVGGGSVLLQGRIGGDALVGGGQVTILSSEVAGDLVVGGGVVRIDAPVRGNIRMGGGEIYLNAPVSGAVTVYRVDSLTLGPKALIRGSLTYASSQELTMDPGAQVLGDISYEPRAKREFKGKAFAAAAFLSAWFVLKTLMVLVSSLVIGLTFRRYSATVIGTVAASPWLELGRGFVTVIVLPALSVLLLMTVVGIPLGVLGFVGLIALSIAGCALTPVLLGALLYKRIKKMDEYVVSWKTILLGTAAYAILALIPVIGWAAIAFSSLSLIGAAVGLKWRIAKEWR